MVSLFRVVGAFVLVALVAAGCGNDAAEGQVSVTFSELENTLGTDLAGVLLSDTRRGGTAVAGFAVRVESDPFSHVEMLGNVSVEIPQNLEAAGLWPWPSGVAVIPPGAYTLRVAIGNNYCCYNRWLPAATPGLRICEVAVTITGDPQTIVITDIPALSPETGPPQCGLG